jgi:hypothetical protein|tara:strand:+ start:1094 stop:1534 length:441 start_codon:yes stop_codon:yes gene_type:complete
MATLTPTLTLASTDIFAGQPLNLSVTDTLTVSAPMTDISRMNTNDNIGNGVGILLPEATTDTYFIYLKHTGVLASDGITAANAGDDYVIVTNADGDTDFIRLYPGEFAFFPLNIFDNSDDGVEVGGLKVEKGGADVQINYGFWKRS